RNVSPSRGASASRDEGERGGGGEGAVFEDRGLRIEDRSSPEGGGDGARGRGGESVFEDRGLRIEDRSSPGSRAFDVRSSIFDPRSSVFDFPSSTFDPRSSIFCFVVPSPVGLRGLRPPGSPIAGSPARSMPPPPFR